MWRKIYLIDIGLVKKKNQTGVGEGGGRGGGWGYGSSSGIKDIACAISRG